LICIVGENKRAWLIVHRFVKTFNYVTFPEFSMTTGAAIPITGHADDIVTLVEELNLDHYIFSELLVKKQMKFISVLTQYCLEHGALDRIGYVEQQAMMRDLSI